jgi:hypothetical protein
MLYHFVAYLLTLARNYNAITKITDYALAYSGYKDYKCSMFV